MKKIQPPRFGRWLLRRIFDDRFYDEISGDLEEIFNDRIETKGWFIASVHYFKDVMLSTRNIGLKKGGRRDNAGIMRNVMVIAFRALKKRAWYSSLNVVGLTLSICAAFLMSLYVVDQASYDSHFTNAERVYRVNLEADMNGKRDVYCNVPQPTAAALRSTYPQIEEVARVALTDHIGTLEYKEKKIRSANLVIADSSVLRIFHRQFLEGDESSALSEPASIVLSESMAKELFGRRDVLGERVHFIEFEKDLEITGVIADDTRHSHFPMEAIVSWHTYPQYDSDQWYGAHAYTYILLKTDTDIATLTAQMPAFFNRYIKKTFDEFNGKGKIFFQPLTDIYLSDELVWEPNPHGSRANVVALGFVALFLVAFAMVNYVNLATARAAERALEVGIRKLLGSSPWFLRGQFVGESIILSTTAGVLSLLLSYGMLPVFNRLSGLDLAKSQLFTLRVAGSVLLLSFVVGLVAGIIPAAYLSSMKTLQGLKGKFSGRGEILRRTLVITQYFIAAILVAGVLVVYEQISFIKNKEIGFNKENLVNVVVSRDSIVNNHIDVYAKAIENFPEVISTSLAYVQVHRETDSFSPTLQNPDGTKFQMGSDIIYADASFIPTIGAEMATGRNFDKNLTEAESSVLINEAAAKKFGWEKGPLEGKFAGFTPREPAMRNVIGVVKDFHLGVSYQYVHPTIIFLSQGGEPNLYVRIGGGDIHETIQKMQDSWKEHFPGYNFEYSFADMDLGSLYERETKFLALLGGFCAITLTIASLGIIGLISYATQSKRKDIAIRKVLGSTSANIVAMLSRKFVYLLVAAALLSIPAGYYVLTLWLTGFDYRIEIGVWPFVVAFLVCLFFTAVSILYHAVYAALANPVNALKYE
ncbi:MAG TPA: ABC transporter permease [Cyclobacteriaceae bacterium]|nr:ABC transporter permease [Cyclobacteriaceae bacterium]